MKILINNKEEENKKLIDEKAKEIIKKINDNELKKLTQNLEEKDIIIRKPSDSDKRRNVITLSERIKKNIVLVKERLYALENTLQKSIKKEETEIFITTLDKMIENVKSSETVRKRVS